MARRKSKEEWKIYGNVFDQFTLRVLHHLEGQGHFSALESAYRMGKEANVFIASSQNSPVMVKIYRLENCNFNKMHEYLVQDERFEDLKGQRRKIIFSWVQREYRNLLKAREAIRVPTPLAVRDNVLVMECIGEPSQELKDEPPKDPVAFLDAVVVMMRKLWAQGLVHGDLSAFNILNHEEEPVFIDFSQATTTKSANAQELLARDVRNILLHFRKLGVVREEAEVVASVLGKEE